jgi:hypothetical protein
MSTNLAIRIEKFDGKLERTDWVLNNSNCVNKFDFVREKANSPELPASNLADNRQTSYLSDPTNWKEKE